LPYQLKQLFLRQYQGAAAESRRHPVGEDLLKSCASSQGTQRRNHTFNAVLWMGSWYR
jgi:hypothetical protein